MVRIITVDDVRNLLRKVTLKTFILQLANRLEHDFSHWEAFNKMPRIAHHYEHGVIELMPASNHEYYAFKFVNGHPGNPMENKQTVVAVGTLADIVTGYPVMISEMTLLTAIRTAVVSVLAAKYLAVAQPERFGIIGTGAQSEFQVLAHHFVLGINEVYYYDIDNGAMQKFANNLQAFDIGLHRCDSAEQVVEHSQILTTATAEKTRARVLQAEWVKPGTHINAIGGDCPGKTELDVELLKRSKVVVEYIEQSEQEGEIQHIGRDSVHAELWQLITGAKPGRETEQEITLFDSVGFALEDYSTLRLVYKLAEQYHVGHVLDMVPEANDPRDLYSLLRGSSLPPG